MQDYTYNATLLPTVQCISFIPIQQRFSRLLFVSIAWFIGDTESVCVLAELLQVWCHRCQEVVVKYMELLQQKSYVPRFSYGSGLLRDDGGPNRLFFTYLFRDDALAISFLHDAKLIRNQVLCDTCGRYVVQR